MHFTPFAFSGILAGVSSLAFGLLVLVKTNNSRLGRVWFLFSLSVAVWGFGAMVIGLTTNSEKGLLAWRLAHALGVVWIAPCFLHFVRIFIGESNESPKFHYLIGLAFASLMATPLLFSQARLMFGSFVYALNGILFPVYTIWWFGLVGLGHYHLIKAYKRVETTERNRIRYFFLATVIGYSGGSLCFLPNFGIELYPWGNFTIFLYPLIMYYAILRYRLMDTRILFRRAGLAVLVYVALLIASVPLIGHLHRQMLAGHAVSPEFLGFEIMLIGAILSLGPLIYAYFVRLSSYFHEHTMAGLTHELKSPLAVIESAIGVLGEKIRLSGDSPDQKAYVEMIERHTDRLKGFVNDLLQVYKVPNKKEILTSKVTDISALCHRVADEHSALAQAKGIQLTIVSDNPSVSLACDEDKIKKVVSNLLSNAIKFTDEGHIRINIEKDRDGIKISMRDTGCGIPLKDLPYVFDRFFQGRTTNGSQGTGIGLTIAKTWVEAHGGQIWAESDGEGKGTTVTFRLPY